MLPMDRATFEQAIAWNPTYHPAWDADPDAYVAAGIVAWGRTRRLGKLVLPPRFKAYFGVQHVDPRLGWSGLDAPEARFFVSWFDGPRCLGLRVAPTLVAAREIAWRVVSSE